MKKLTKHSFTATLSLLPIFRLYPSVVQQPTRKPLPHSENNSPNSKIVSPQAFGLRIFEKTHGIDLTRISYVVVCSTNKKRQRTTTNIRKMRVARQRSGRVGENLRNNDVTYEK